MTASGGWFFYIFVGYFMRLRFFVRIFMLFDWIWNFILSTVSHILFVEKWKSLEEEGAENMQKKVGLNSDMRVYFDMDGTIAKWCDVPVEESRKPGYYADLEPETELLDFMRAAMKRGENIYILSSYYTDTRALLEKKKWLDQYLPEIDSAHCLFVPYGKNKAEFIEAMLHRRLSRADILIDDHTPNQHRWEAAGGTGIKWLNQVNGNNGRFEGARVGSAEELRAVLDNASQG